jgi:hypothetical protein
MLHVAPTNVAMLHVAPTNVAKLNVALIKNQATKNVEKNLDSKVVAPTSSSDTSMESLSSKKKNPRILLLDFKKTAIRDIETRLMRIRSAVHENSQIRSFSMKSFPNGNISILFRSPAARDVAERILREKMVNDLQPPELQGKNRFELIAKLPRNFNPAEVKHAIEASKYVSIGHGKYVFLGLSAIKATELIEKGVYVNPYFIEFELYAFAPQIGCSECGSIAHKFCSPNDDISLNSRCIHCSSEEHKSIECSKLKQELKTAQIQKKASYADILKKRSTFLLSSSSHKIVSTNQLPQLETTFISQQAEFPKISTRNAQTQETSTFSKGVISANSDKEINTSLIQTIVLTVLQILNVEENNVPELCKKVSSILQPKRSSEVEKQPSATSPVITSAASSTLKKPNKKQSSKSSKYAPKIEQIRRRLHLRKRDGYLSDGDQEILSESDIEFESNRRKKNRVTFSDNGDNHDSSSVPMFFTKFSCGEFSDNSDEALDHFKEQHNGNASLFADHIGNKRSSC